MRHVPIINDTTHQDAITSGMHNFAKIIDSGSVYPGVILEESSEEFQEIFQKASAMISKSQGNNVPTWPKYWGAGTHAGLFLE